VCSSDLEDKPPYLALGVRVLANTETDYWKGREETLDGGLRTSLPT